MDDAQELEVLSRRLNLATRAARIAVWEWDLESNALYWSPVFMQILGVEPEDFGGLLSDFTDRLVPEDRERVENALHAHIHQGAPYDIEYEMFHQTGRRVAIAAQGEIALGPDGRANRMVGTVRDISDRRTLEARLLQAERIAHIGHWIVDMKSNELSWSPETFRIHGLEPHGPQPDVESAIEFYHPDDRAMVAETFAKVMQDGEFRELDARLLLRNGETRYVHIDGVAEFSADGQSARLFGIVHDRTDLVKKERQLERAHRLEAVGQLAGGVAHDFNNLLSVILGNLELLQDDEPDGSTNHDPTLIDEAIRAISLGRDLTQSLLNFARSAPLRPEPIAASSLLSDLETVIRRTLPASLSLTVIDRSQRSVFADHGNLEACLLNLVINARDAIPGHGGIVVSARDVDFDADAIAGEEFSLPPGPYVAFMVEDDGRGISPEDIDKVCEPFFTTKPAGEGSGLGLSRVKGFAEQSGGIVHVDSDVGMGTCVSIYLPAIMPSGARMERNEPMAGELTDPLTVLLVEDLGALRRALATRLERQGHTVIAAEDGPSALSAFAAHPEIDLVVSDVVMPGEMQGPDLVSEIRELRPDARAVFISGYSGETLRKHHGLRRGDVCLTKPITESELGRAIRRAMTPH